jgi:biotin carboxylase
MASPGKKANPPAVTTSVKLPARMKAAIAKLASGEGMTLHGYLVSLIKQGLERATRRREFIAEARAALAEFDRTGTAYRAEDVHRYLDDKAHGKNSPHPQRVQWRK